MPLRFPSPPTNRFFCLLAFCLALLVLDPGSHTVPGTGLLRPVMGLPGGKQSIPLNNQNRLHLESLAKYAVQQHNLLEHDQLSYVELVSAEEQVVSGMLYYLKLKAASGGQTKLYQAVVWEKAWQHFKSLQSFEPV